MSNEKRVLVLTLTFAECTKEQADAILATVTTLCGASADLIQAPVMITACPPNAPKRIQEASTRTLQPKGRECLCPGCRAQVDADARGESTMVPLDIPIEANGPDYSQVTEALAALDDAIPSTEPSGMGKGSSPQLEINVRRAPRGPAS